MPPDGSPRATPQSAFVANSRPQALVRPAPVVHAARGGTLDAVRRGEHAAARRGHPAQLPHRLRRVVAVLEHLGAEDDVEGAVLDRQRLDAPAQLGGRVLDDVDADVLGRPLREEGVVRLRSAADVEDAVAVADSSLRLAARRRAARGRPTSASSEAGAAAPPRASRTRARGGRYPRSFWNAAKEGFFAPEAVSRPDCQPSPPRRSSRSRNQRNMSIRGWRLTIP